MTGADVIGLFPPGTSRDSDGMSNNYNGARRIPVVFADGGGARLVVRRERWDELLSRDVGY